MNASEVIDDTMSLEEKLKAIDAAMATAQAEHKRINPSAAPLDPADLTQCWGCQ